MLSLLASGAVGGLVRALLEPETTLGMGCKAGEWKGLLFNAVVGLACAWIFIVWTGKEESLILGFLVGYVASDVLDSLLYIARKPFSRKSAMKKGKKQLRR